LLQVYPDDARLRLDLADQLRNFGRFHQAYESLAPLLNQQSVEAVKARLLALDVQQAEFYGLDSQDEARKDKLKALENTLESLAKDQLSVEELVHLAKVSLELNKPGLAADLYVHLVSADPPRQSAWLAAAGQWYMASQQPEKASNCYWRASKVVKDLERSRYYTQLAVETGLAADKGTVALQILNDYLNHFPKDQEFLDKAISIAQSQGEYDQALQWGYQRLGLNPNNSHQVGRQLELALAVGELSDAFALAQQYVALNPDNEIAHERLARIAEWSKQPDRALNHWVWLARRDSGGPALEKALGLARGLFNDPVRIEMLALSSDLHPLSDADLKELTDAFIRSQDLAEAETFLHTYVKRYPDERKGWQALAHIQEHQGKLADAVKTWQYIGDNFGDHVDTTLHQAELLAQLSQTERAFSLLKKIQTRVRGKNIAYWSLFGEQAWQLNRTTDALTAYRILWKSRQADLLAADRLTYLACDAGLIDEALNTAEKAFHKFNEPRMLLLAMDVAIGAHRWRELTRLMEVASRREQHFQNTEMYWLLKAQLYAHHERLPEAQAYYEQALQINPKSVSARVSLLWLMIQNDDNKRLKEYIPRWQQDAIADSSFWGAYAVALFKLGRIKEALPWFEKQTRTKPQEYNSLLAYADALDRTGRAAASWRLRRHVLEKLRVKFQQQKLQQNMQLASNLK
jgi:tetratricopeptide (TPR) repeat protein